MVERMLPRALRPPIAPTQFGDPLATQIEWTPAARGGASFTTHRLRQVGLDCMQFRKSAGMVLFALAFLLPGIGVFVAGVVTLDQGPGWFGVLFGLVFGGAGVLLLHGGRPATFDRHRGWYYKGREPTGPEPSGVVRLADVHALQILSEHCSGSKGSSYFSYEINLVLEDGTRINVIDHGSRSHVRADAAKLAEFLDVPVWDAC
jgi:hypothetical protein